MDEIDERGIVFLDNVSRPFLIRMRGDVPWLFYWHADGHWTSLREVTQSEIWSMMMSGELSQDVQDYYHNKHDEWAKEYEPDTS